VEVYPYVEYANICWPARRRWRIFIVAMIGGGITFIDDKSRGLHEGYLLTPIKKTELVLGGLIGAGTVKGLMAGMVLTYYRRLDRGNSATCGTPCVFSISLGCHWWLPSP
jgi:ABC-2 type transport system permease protein